MSDSSAGPNPRQFPFAPSVLLCVLLVGIEYWLRLVLYRNYPVGVGYGFPILLVGWTRRRKLLWGTCLAFAFIAGIKFYLNYPASTLPATRHILSMLMFMADLAVLTGIVDLVIRREAAMLLGGDTLHRREQELKMSNEGLLERQQTMDILLKLSRTLTVGQTRGDIVSALAGTIHELLGGTTATAIWNRRDQTVEMIGNAGFGKSGPEKDAADFAGSFAGLVIERQQTVGIASLSQRPEIKTERNGEGLEYHAVVGAPLKSGGNIAGALVVYSPQARSWTESDLSLVESLAAQASVSIAATRLMEQAEDEHRELQTIVDAVPFGILRTNARGTRLICNPAAAGMLGFPEVIEAESLNWPKMTLIGPKGEIPQARSPLIRALRGEVTAAMEMDLRLGEDDTMTILCNAAPIRDRSGAISGAISAFVDISVLKALREDMRDRERIFDEASTLRSRFLAAVSHEIRTPANAINLLAELLRKSVVDPAQADEIPEICREIERSSTGLTSLVTDVLDLLRLDTGRLELNETEIDLGVWIDEQCKKFGSQAREKKLRLICDVPESGIRLRADKGKLSRVVAILVGNAIKFTEQGEVRIECSLLDDRTLRFDVIDTGVGIPAENRSAIFDELAQLKNAMRSKNGGTGLGLSIARRTVRLMGGKLEVVSEPGKGSTFSFFLPSSKVIG
jgi:signal transduction histidine kinase